MNRNPKPWNTVWSEHQLRILVSRWRRYRRPPRRAIGEGDQSLFRPPNLRSWWHSSPALLGFMSPAGMPIFLSLNLWFSTWLSRDHWRWIFFFVLVANVSTQPICFSFWMFIAVRGIDKFYPFLLSNILWREIYMRFWFFLCKHISQIVVIAFGFYVIDLFSGECDYNFSIFVINFKLLKSERNHFLSVRHAFL